VLSSKNESNQVLFKAKLVLLERHYSVLLFFLKREVVRGCVSLKLGTNGLGNLQSIVVRVCPAYFEKFSSLQQYLETMQLNLGQFGVNFIFLLCAELNSGLVNFHQSFSLRMLVFFTQRL
jgi:hypothetical protein